MRGDVIGTTRASARLHQFKARTRAPAPRCCRCVSPSPRSGPPSLSEQQIGQWPCR
jgi:hypothetical protein